MFVLILAYLGGVLTIISPCILPVLPFVFARADRPFAREGLPLLAGMGLTFALVATLASDLESAGEGSIAVDASDLSSGSYTVRLRSANGAVTTKLTVTK